MRVLGVRALNRPSLRRQMLLARRPAGAAAAKLASLHGEFATILDTGEILRSLGQTSFSRRTVHTGPIDHQIIPPNDATADAAVVAEPEETHSATKGVRHRIDREIRQANEACSWT